MSEKHLLGLIVVFGIGWYLMQRPDCNRGCKTIAEHIANHALDEATASLF